MDLRAIAMGVSFALIWASAFTATRVVVLAFPPLTALVIRFAISGAIGMGLAWLAGQRLRFTRAQWRGLIIFGVCQNALYLGLNWVAMQWVEASVAAILASSMPLMVALAGWLTLGERLRPMAVLGLVLGFLGVAAIMLARMKGGHLDVTGLVLCVIGAIALTVATLAARGAGGRQNVMMAVGLQMLVGSAALLLPALLLEAGLPLHWSPRVIAWLSFSIFLPGLAATWIWFMLVERVGAVRAATFHFLSPMFGVAIAAALLGEHFTWIDVTGAAVVAAGILMVQLTKVQEKRAA